ncbi:MAG TPA: SRPBCC family protein [Solirubrobacterales bacterium]|nr:SRPBCC family protein [Solirubrobacterales bacterium]
MASFTLVREVKAPPEVVFDVLTDHRRYSEMTGLRKSVLEREGESDPNGVGAIRKLTAVGPPMREEVIAFDRPSRFSYTVLSGLPVRDHVGTVSLEPAGQDGTKVTYALRTTPTVPVAGGLVVAAIKQAIKQLLNGVSAEAERRAANANG